MEHVSYNMTKHEFYVKYDHFKDFWSEIKHSYQNTLFRWLFHLGTKMINQTGSLPLTGLINTVVLYYLYYLPVAFISPPSWLADLPVNSLCQVPNNLIFRFSEEMEREPVTQLPLLDVNKATLHLNSSSTFTGLVKQCRRETPPNVFFLLVKTSRPM